MCRILIGVGLLALTAGGITVWAASHLGSSMCSSGTAAVATAGSESCASSEGRVAGTFDALMSGTCRFSCATKLDYDPKDVIAQPGAKSGLLTQCPVSGVVFAVDAERPRVRVASAEYLLCCDTCAEKLRKNPGRYLKL